MTLAVLAILAPEVYALSAADAELVRLDLFEPEELLRRWCEDTALAVFPVRRIGRLEPGFEASFLVLEADPLVDPQAVRGIRLRVKQGRLIDVPPRASGAR